MQKKAGSRYFYVFGAAVLKKLSDFSFWLKNRGKGLLFLAAYAIIRFNCKEKAFLRTALSRHVFVSEDVS